MGRSFLIIFFIIITKEEIKMRWLILLALIPLSRILFNIALWIGHRKKNKNYKPWEEICYHEKMCLI